MYWRPYKPEDRTAVLALWYANNKNDVYLPPESDSRFKTVYCDENDHDKIIAYSCINMLPELILVHNKNLDPHKKYEMLGMVHALNEKNGKDVGWPQLYAFIDGPNWIRHLKDAGFKLFEKGIYYLELRK